MAHSSHRYRLFSWLSFIAIIGLLSMSASTKSFAQDQDNSPSHDNHFVVNISGVDYTSSQNIVPCFPLIAHFRHSNPEVTKIRMQYPLNPRMYMIFPVQDEAHIKLHEDYMKLGEYSFSDFIALDDYNKEYGTIRLTFIPPYNPKANACDFVSS